MASIRNILGDSRANDFEKLCADIQKRDTERRRALIILESDEYWNQVYNKWLPVPRFWIGDTRGEHSDAILSTK